MFKALFISLFYFSMAKSQVIFTIKKFKVTQWACNNRDSLFFKSDTIKLVKIGDKASLTNGKTNDVASYFSGDNFVTLDFKNNNNLNLSLTQVETWTVSSKKGKYKWEFNKRKQVLKLYYANKLFATFIPFSEKDVEIKSNYIDLPTVKTKEITLQRNLNL